MIEIFTPRLVVRDPLPFDLEGWHRLKSDRENMRFVPYLQIHDPEESRRDLQNAIAAAKAVPRENCFFSVADRESGTFLGTLGYRTKTLADGSQTGVDIGWFFLPEAQGKGCATEAFRALLPSMFNEWGITVVQASCYVDNKASERIMQRAGMRFVGEYVRENDAPEQIRCKYQLTKKDYEAT